MVPTPVGKVMVSVMYQLSLYLNNWGRLPKTTLTPHLPYRHDIGWRSLEPPQTQEQPPPSGTSSVLVGIGIC